jgi:hypothetical protein
MAPVLLAVFSLLLASLNQAYAASSGVKWTIMIYMAADNDLESAFPLDIEELESVGSTSSVKVLVLVDRSPEPYEERAAQYGVDPQAYGDWSDARIYLVERHAGPGIGSKLVARLGEVNTGDPRTLVDFVKFSVEKFPADHYMLILWNHGSGFSVAVDESQGDELSLNELQEALEQVKGIGVHVDIIGFDACLMATVGTLYTVADHADYMIASEEMEPGAGWPLDSLLSILADNPSIQPEDLARLVVEAYGRFYSSQGYESTTLSAIDLRGISSKDVSEAISELSRLAVETPQALQEARVAVQEYGVIGSYGGLTVDFISLVEHVKEKVSGGLAGFVDKLKESIVANYAGQEKKGSRGIAIFYPLKAGIIDRYVGSFELASVAGWDKALRVLVNIEPEISSEPIAESQVTLSLPEASSGAEVHGLLSGAGSLQLDGRPGEELVVIVGSLDDEGYMVSEVVALRYDDGGLANLFDLIVDRAPGMSDFLYPAVSVADDYDGDGLDELVMAEQLYVSDAMLPVTRIVYLDFEAKPNGRLGVGMSQAELRLYEVGGVSVGDVNGDGRLELVVVGSRYIVDEIGALQGMYGQVIIVDLDSFSPIGNFSVGSETGLVAATGVTLFDADGDGVLDIVVSFAKLTDAFEPIPDQDTIMFFAYTGNSVNELGRVRYPAIDLASGDVDADGRPELVAANSVSPKATVFSVEKGKVKVLADVDFSNTQYEASESVSIIDIDGDEVNEVIVVLVSFDADGYLDDAGIRIFSLAGRPELEYSGDGMLSGGNVEIPMAVDVNGDNKLEIAFIKLTEVGVSIGVYNITNYVDTNGSLTGSVVDENGDPVVGAEVTASVPRQGVYYTTITDDEGRFRFDSIPAGTYEVVVVKDDAVAVVDVSVEAGKDKSITVTLTAEQSQGAGQEQEAQTTTTPPETTLPAQTETTPATTPHTQSSTLPGTVTSVHSTAETATETSEATSATSTLESQETATTTVVTVTQTSTGPGQEDTATTQGGENAVGEQGSGGAVLNISMVSLPLTSQEAEATTPGATQSTSGESRADNTAPKASTSEARGSSNTYYAVPVVAALASLAYIAYIRRKSTSSLPPPPPPPPPG